MTLRTGTKLRLRTHPRCDRTPTIVFHQALESVSEIERAAIIVWGSDGVIEIDASDMTLQQLLYMSKVFQLRVEMAMLTGNPELVFDAMESPT